MNDLRTKVTKEEVYDHLLDKEDHTKKEMAKHFDVSPSTIRIKLSELVRDGVSLISGEAGYRYVEPGDMDDEMTARAVEKMTRWIIATVARQAFSAKPMKKLMTRARKLLPKDKEERLIVRKYLVQLTHLIDWEETEEE